MYRTHVAIVGAGPYGLSIAAHLQAAGIDFRIFGATMQFWKDMPAGMLLRSGVDGSHLPDPQRRYTLHDYAAATGQTLPERVPIAEFTRYGEWFQQHAVPNVDPRFVASVTKHDGPFRLTLSDGDTLRADRVVVAAGLTGCARRPAIFKDLPASGVTHTFDERDFSCYAGRAIAVVGGGQSALECAVLMNEAGAKVEVISRGEKVNWLSQSSKTFSRDSGWLGRVLYPPGAVGPIGINWIVQLPGLYRSLPESARRKVFDRALRPAGAGWVKERSEGITFSSGAGVERAEMRGDRVHLTLTNGEERTIDHVVLGTGYQLDIRRYGFLDEPLLQRVSTFQGHPYLSAGFESTEPGLHFVGAAADMSFGPLMRSVAGTGYTARAVTDMVKTAARRSASDRQAAGEYQPTLAIR